jgi:hypothetical protein
MFATFRKEANRFFEDSIIWQETAPRLFADFDMVLNCGPEVTDIRGEWEIHIQGWTPSKTKTKEVVRKVRGATNKIEFCEIIDRVMWVLSELSPYFPSEDTESNPLPPELNTERAQRYFGKAISGGLIQRTAQGYTWVKGRDSMLAYFAQRVFCENSDGSDNGRAFPESALNKLFNKSRLGKARSQLANNKSGKPVGYGTIDALFCDKAT